MKRRSFVKIALASWVTPIVTVVSLPAHAETSQTRNYSGNVGAQSKYSILSEWKANATLRPDGSVDLSAQNIDDTVRVAVIIDELGPASPGQITTTCTEIADYVDASYIAISDSEITIKIFLLVLGVLEVVSFTLPQNINLITFPDVSATCTLS